MFVWFSLCVASLSWVYHFFFVLCIILSYLLVIISLRETSGKIIAFFLLSIEKRVRFRKGSGCSKVLCLQLVEEIRMITVSLFSLWCKFYKMCEQLLNQFPFTMWLTVDMRFDGLWRVDFVQTTSSSLGTLIEGKFFFCVVLYLIIFLIRTQRGVFEEKICLIIVTMVCLFFLVKLFYIQPDWNLKIQFTFSPMSKSSCLSFAIMAAAIIWQMVVFIATAIMAAQARASFGTRSVHCCDH